MVSLVSAGEGDHIEIRSRTLREGLLVTGTASATIVLLAGDGRPCFSRVPDFRVPFDCGFVRDGNGGLDISGGSLLGAGVNSTMGAFLTEEENFSE